MHLYWRHVYTYVQPFQQCEVCAPPPPPPPVHRLYEHHLPPAEARQQTRTLTHSDHVIKKCLHYRIAPKNKQEKVCRVLD